MILTDVCSISIWKLLVLHHCQKITILKSGPKKFHCRFGWFKDSGHLVSVEIFNFWFLKLAAFDATESSSVAQSAKVLNSNREFASLMPTLGVTCCCVPGKDT